MAVKSSGEQVVEFVKRALKFRVVVPRLEVLSIWLARNASNLHERYARDQKLRQSELVWLKLRIRKLHAEGDLEVVPFSGVEGELPERERVQAAGLRLYVFPVATDVENVDERQSGDIFDMLRNRFAALTRGNRRTVLFPNVTDQT